MLRIALVALVAAVAAASPEWSRGDAAKGASCFLGAADVVRDVMAIKGKYTPSDFGGTVGGRPWHVCQYVSGSLTADKPTSVLIGVFPFAARISERDWTANGMCAQAFLTAVQAKPRACSLLLKALKAGDPARKTQLLSSALSVVGEVAKVRGGIAGGPAFLYDASRLPGSDAWVYVRSRGSLVHTHCIRASNPDLRAMDCAVEAARVVAPKIGRS